MDLQNINVSKLGHAYLFEITSFLDEKEVIFAFLKRIFCPEEYIDNCQKCKICHQIDENKHYNISIYNNEEKTIVKDDILSLQKKLTTTNFTDEKKVYIINAIENVNLTVSNSLLKTLEEPSDNVIAILLTKNINKVLPTIRSRCQIFSLQKRNYFNIVNFADLKDVALFIVKEYEKKKEKIIIDFKNITDQIIDKKDYYSLVKIMILIYENVIDYLLQKKIKYDYWAENDIIDLASQVSISSVMQKLDKLLEISNYLTYNVNTNLIFDKMFIEMSEIDEMCINKNI